MSKAIELEIAALYRMTTSELAERFEELHGHPTHTRHRDYLIRKVAWRMQANAEGDLSERLRRIRTRAAELANDAEVRVMAPKTLICPPQPAAPASVTRALPNGEHNDRPANMPFMTATASPDEIRAFRLQVGDVLITKDSEDWKDIGVPAVVLSTADDLVCGYHLAILRPRPQMISGPFLSLALRSQASTAQLSVSAKGVTRFGLSQGAIKDLLIATPPQDEQQRIIQYVHAKTKTLRHAIEQASREVDLIREYRTRLIADVVTGKVDVRHLAAELGDEPELDEGGFASVEADADVEELDEVMEEAADVDD